MLSKSSVSPRKRTPGRARSDKARIAILTATLKLLESKTLQQVSIESIAKEAGVGKATIYRWWPSKASVVIDAFVHKHIVQTPFPDVGTSSEKLATHMKLLIQQYNGWAGRLVAQILGEGQSDPEVLKEFRERFWNERRAMVRKEIEKGRKNGEFRVDMDVDYQMDMLYSPIYQRLIMGHLPLDTSFAEGLAETMLRLLRNSEAF